MGKITSASTKIGKNLYFYAVLYCIATIGITIVTIDRYEIVFEKLGLLNWGELILLLGLLYSLPVLTLTFLTKVNKSIAIMIAGVTCMIIFIVYWISTAGASDLIVKIRSALNPLLGIFFIFAAWFKMKDVWPKGVR